MRQYILLTLFTVGIGLCSIGQTTYTFTPIESWEASPIKSQGRTGTCWSFSTSSFIESELMRLGKGPVDISEMFIVRNIYQEKAQNYISRQGKANFSQGSLSHDVMRAIKKYGLVTENEYSGLRPKQNSHNHGEMEAMLKGALDGVLTKPGKQLTTVWDDAIEAILDVYLGKPNPFVMVEGDIQMTPLQYAHNHLKFNPDDYVTLTSFTHEPFYSSFILNVPDNYSNGSYFNIPLEELIETTDNALKNGYTLCWDADVSEKGFSRKEGVAVYPYDQTDEGYKKAIKGPEKDMHVTQTLRQISFEDQSTTDDHLMHITGMAKDQNGNPFYYVKNSWGEIGPYNGYLYVSKGYFAMKTIGVMIHKDAIPAKIKSKLGL